MVTVLTQKCIGELFCQIYDILIWINISVLQIYTSPLVYLDLILVWTTKTLNLLAQADAFQCIYVDNQNSVWAIES